MGFNVVQNQCAEIKSFFEQNANGLTDETLKNQLKEKILNLTLFIIKNNETLIKEFSENESQKKTYKEIKKIVPQNGEYSSFVSLITIFLKNAQILTLQSQGRGYGTQKKMNKLENQYELFSFSQFREMNRSLNKIEEFDEFSVKIVKLIVSTSKDIQSVKTLLDFYSIKDETKRNEIMASWIDFKRVSLKSTGLSIEELKNIAPHLHYANCGILSFKDEEEANSFIKCFSKAHYLSISSNEITRIEGLSSELKTLNCSFSSSLQVIDFSNAKALEYVWCNSSPLLEECNRLSDAIRLKHFVCDYCLVLKSVDLSKAKALELFSCCYCPFKTINLPEENVLKEFFCRMCPLLEEINNLSKALRIFVCDSSPLLKVIDLLNVDALVRFNCHDCLLLENIKNFNVSKLIDFSSSNCSLLKEFDLSKATVLESFSIRNCPLWKVIDLSNAKALKKYSGANCPLIEVIDLSNSDAIEEIDCSNGLLLKSLKLVNTSVLKKISIKNCPLLQTINLSKARELQNIECENCLELTSLQTTVLPNCSYLDCSGSLKLIKTQLPQIRFSGQAILSKESDGRICKRVPYFIVNTDNLERTPWKILLELTNSFSENNYFFPNIDWELYQKELFESELITIDAIGRVRGQLVTTLFEHIFKKNNKLFCKSENGGVIPFMKFAGSQDDQSFYKAFVGLIGVCLNSSLLIGKYLDDQFFYNILSLTDEEMASFSITNKSIQKSLYMKHKGLVSFDMESKSSVAFKNESDCFEYQPSLQRLVFIARELKNVLGDQFDWARANPKMFIKKLEGTPVTKEGLQEVLEYRGTVSDGELGRSQNHFNRFIETYQHNLADLVELLTSFRTFGEEKIMINVLKERSLEKGMLINTSSQEVSIPYYLTYEEMEKELLKRLNIFFTVFKGTRLAFAP